MSFHFKPSGRLGREDNAFGLEVGLTQASASKTPVLLWQKERRDGLQGCLDSTANSFMPPALCNFDREMEYTLRLRRGEVSLVERGSSYAFGGPTPTSGWWRLTSRGGTISDIEVLTAEEEFVVSSIKSGASRAVADGSSSLCNKGSAECGGSCWGVCRACGPPRYCVSQQQRPGPHCCLAIPLSLHYFPLSKPADVLPQWLHWRHWGNATRRLLPPAARGGRHQGGGASTWPEGQASL